VVSAAYYLYVVTIMFMRPRPADAPELPPVGGLTQAVIGATVLLIIVLGFAPTQVLRSASRSTIRPPGVPGVIGVPPQATTIVPINSASAAAPAAR
jgi:multisubunit Na+/H+ antiporter MnhB subunit